MADSQYQKSILDAIKNNPLCKKSGISISSYSAIGEKPLAVIPSGFYELDYMLLGPELGGIPMGRIVEFFGPEAGGKSTMGLRVISEAQRLGHTCLLIDVEQAYGDSPGREWLQKIGVNLGENGLLYSGETIAEDIFNLTLASIKAGVKVVMLDSVAAMVPRSESIEESLASTKQKRNTGFDQKHMGGLSKALTAGLTQLNKVVADTGALLICINQVRDYIGFNPSGIPILTRPGGHAFKHYSSLSLQFTKVQTIREGTTIVGNYAKIKVVKCKVGPGYGRETGKDTPNHIAIYYDGRKVTPLENILPIAVEQGIVGKPSARTYRYVALDGSDISATSRDAFIKQLEEHGVVDELTTRVSSGGANQASVVDTIIVDDDDVESGWESALDD